MMNWPGLTTVDNQLQNQGAAAAAGLVSQILGEAVAEEVVLASRLIVRGSTGMNQLDPVEMYDSLVEMARSAQRQLGEQDTLLAFNQAMMRCATTADLVEALVSTHLERLGINRCVLALNEWDDDTDAADHLSTNASRARVLLDYYQGVSRPVPAEPIAVYDVLHKELHEDAMVFQPLSIAGRPLGYVLFNYSEGLAGLPEALRIDLSRTLGAALAAEELTQYAQTLEERVEERTAELKKEVTTRRRAEAELNRLNAGLQRSLMIDGLTGISNRTAFERHFELYGPTGVGTDELALLFVDVDLFKPYNDLYGHVMGDEALRKVASCLTRAVRYPQDLACRWGGEEFAVLLPGSGPDGAMIVAERFMTLLEYARIPHAASTVADHLTASVGLAWTVSHQGLSSTSLIKAADEALYMAKTLGRNRIHQARPVPHSAP
jgi:diguanylate cyclase (GGDEF)-like protein